MYQSSQPGPPQCLNFMGSPKVKNIYPCCEYFSLCSKYHLSCADGTDMNFTSTNKYLSAVQIILVTGTVLWWSEMDILYGLFKLMFLIIPDCEKGQKETKKTALCHSLCLANFRCENWYINCTFGPFCIFAVWMEYIVENIWKYLASQPYYPSQHFSTLGFKLGCPL